MSESEKSFLFEWREAICNSTLPPKVRHVAFVLSMHMNSEGASCWPSLDTITRESGWARSTVCVALADLDKAGYVRREKGGGVGHPTHYEAVIPINEQSGCRTDNSPAGGSEQSGGRTGGRHEGASEDARRQLRSKGKHKEDLLYVEGNPSADALTAVLEGRASSL